jgi:hypothetical protein
MERSFGTLRSRTKVFPNNVNVRRLGLRAFEHHILSIFQLYYNWLRYHGDKEHARAVIDGRQSYLINTAVSTIRFISKKSVIHVLVCQ